MMPIFTAGFFLAVAVLGSGRLCTDAESVRAAADADGDSRGAFAGRSGDGEDESCLVVGIGLLFVPPTVPSFPGRGFGLVFLLLIGADEASEESNWRSPSLEDESEESE